MTAVKVLPLPVAIWISARGRSSASERSRLVIASICAGQSPGSIRRAAAICSRPERGRAGVVAAPDPPRAPGRCRTVSAGCGARRWPTRRSVSGRWKPKTAAAARLGVEPVGEAGLDAGALVEERQRATPGREWAGSAGAYLPVWTSTPVRVSPRFLASMMPTALPSRRAGNRPRRAGDELADGDAPPGGEVERRAVLHDPAGQAELAVDILTRELFRIGHVVSR